MKRRDVLAAITDLTSDETDLRQAAVNTLEAMPRGFLEDHPLPKKWVTPYLPRLAHLLTTNVPGAVKAWCAQLIGESEIRSPDFLKALIGALDSKDDGVLQTVIWAIGEYGASGSCAVDSIFHHTLNRNREVRWRAVWALSRIRPKGQEYAELFAKLIDDQDSLVRGYAVLGFVSATDPSPWAVAQLERAAKDEDEMPRIHAQRTLEHWAAGGRG